jgi:aldehyde:ferredoxin oxidoreductase
LSKATPQDKGKLMVYGYAGKILRVDLTKENFTNDILEEIGLRKYLGGATLDIKYVYDEVTPETEWSDPENRIFIGSGQLGGTNVSGTGSMAIVTKSALTNGVASTQANDFFGVFLRFSDFDGIVIQGAASGWVYLYIHDGKAELRDASHLVSKDTLKIDQMIKEEMQKIEK